MGRRPSLSGCKLVADRASCAILFALASRLPMMSRPLFAMAWGHRSHHLATTSCSRLLTALVMYFVQAWTPARALVGDSPCLLDEGVFRLGHGGHLSLRWLLSFIRKSPNKAVRLEDGWLPRSSRTCNLVAYITGIDVALLSTLRGTKTHTAGEARPFLLAIRDAESNPRWLPRPCIKRLKARPEAGTYYYQTKAQPVKIDTPVSDHWLKHRLLQGFDAGLDSQELVFW